MTISEGQPDITGDAVSPALAVQHSVPPSLLLAPIMVNHPIEAVGSNSSEQFTLISALKIPLAKM
jgi:hypothetical protein